MSASTGDSNWGNTKIKIKWDVNGDWKVDIADYISVLNIMNWNEYVAEADINGDWKVDIADYVSIVNLMSASTGDSNWENTKIKKSASNKTSDRKINNASSDKSEIQAAYNRAYENWITTASTFKQANLNWKLTRVAAAKMLSNYAINVLGMKPDTSKTPHFWDVSAKLNAQYGNAVTLSYQLWIMWVWSKNFRPYATLTRAELASTLSRLLYWTADGNWGTKYYEPHISTLYNKWVINYTTPSMGETRGNLLLMLYRTKN